MRFIFILILVLLFSCTKLDNDDIGCGYYRGRQVYGDWRTDCYYLNNFGRKVIVDTKYCPC